MPPQKHNQTKHLNHNKKSNGFKIGKLSKMSESYRGKAVQIKKTLIHKAKLKKQRAKELIQAGYSTETKSHKGPNQSTSRSDPTNAFELKRGMEVNDPMDLDTSTFPQPKLGPRKDGMRIDHDESQSQSQFNSLKRPQKSSHSTNNNEIIETQPSLKKRKIQESQPFTSSSNLPDPHNPTKNNRSSLSRLKKNQMLHPNGQPRLSVKLNRMLDKIQRGA
ncbi:uncharacterized protein MELLADRAFT_68653 [Melampsora larici-populina 98AG31]|uniref:rRNA-processing protein FYV7 n=1 Tax=Melampsora larici-populina (strain 98AG31 / pathotype 3-4-7) TaxID=747676 RepID=F4S7K7_MELLP|nr:uncharacterized protein MELLADRAFT_68653 [Melampsora larici-populina 98AG31]EGF99335.1 hypothetical protein MELLADRAFT_68653 [Melampsora larici-populina 98AG31]